jgi:hypothetical protein
VRWASQGRGGGLHRQAPLIQSWLMFTGVCYEYGVLTLFREMQIACVCVNMLGEFESVRTRACLQQVLS